MSSRDTLVIVSPLAAVPRPSGRVILTGKFINGMQVMARLWPGPVVALCEPVSTATDNLDNCEVEPSRLPFQLDICSFDSPDLASRLRDRALALGMTYYRQNHLSRLCRSIGVPCVYLTENTLRTRLQMIRADQPNPLIRLRRYWWEWNQERRQVAAIRLAAGIQCNGVPTLEAYRHLHPSALLFFASQARDEQLATESELAVRSADLRSGRPLRLVSSGRLVKIKGADHLPRVAHALARLGVTFELFVCGGGVLAPVMRAEIERLHVSEWVTMPGVLDFTTEIVPLLKTADLFVCCHPQGDPSSTYLEMLSCGVPIVGYANEALTGLLGLVDAGWTVPIGDIKALAQRVRELNEDRSGLEAASLRALEFARRHTLEHTFERRIDHLKSLVSRSV